MMEIFVCQVMNCDGDVCLPGDENVMEMFVCQVMKSDGDICLPGDEG